MRVLILLVGLQGAGKTTILGKVTEALVLKPSTQRKPRYIGESEYHFEIDWIPDNYAWTIDRGTSKYGMRNDELEKIQHVGITVFDPSNLEKFLSGDLGKKFELVTVGLDTIGSLEVQHARVGQEEARFLDQTSFDAQRKVVQNCDVVLAGDAEIVAAAVNEIAFLLGGRGGIISGASIRKLMAAGTLLENGDLQQVETASYDLRLQNKYWCQGKYHDLTDSNPTMEIPPYSFVIVTAVEQALTPRFLVGAFDIRVSLFISGVILSNGPQVDPGYRGALLCTLYNPSGRKVCLSKNEHFATIQYQTTALNAEGYKAQYQNKKTFQDFVNANIAISPGGQIKEELTTLDQKLSQDIGNIKKDWWTAMGVVLAVVLTVFAVIASNINSLIDKVTQATDKSNEVVAKAESAIGKLELAGEKMSRTIETGEAQVAKVNTAIDELKQTRARFENDNTKKHQSVR